uniref:hypothetical protein n=1 Tax=Paractinoplanes polyasparticus TaxID=2856853 RepID=UPI001C85414D|nr:hypothetical protein [Actinoplanes polyasparticus]
MSESTTLELARQAGLPTSYPLAWAALTADDAGRERGAAAAGEVIALEAAAGAMDRDDPLADVYLSAAGRLSRLMFQDVMTEIIDRRPRSPHLDRVRAARPIPITATWAGPVAETWLRSLTPVVDLPAALRQHRLATLLKHAGRGEVREAYRDRTGRYVLVLAGSRMCAEGHRDPAVAATWTDETVLAADRPVPGSPAGPLLALTPEADGSVRADPFPASLVDGGPLTFEFGPGHHDAVRHVMRLLLTLALEGEAADFATRPFVFDTLTEHAGLKLWPQLTAPGDELRLPWPTVRALAAADVAEVRRMLAVDAPPIHRYYAILDGDRFWQVVRQSATPDGYATDQHIAPDGAWTHSTILAEIGRGKRYDQYRQLSPHEIDRHVETIRSRRPARGA